MVRTVSSQAHFSDGVQAARLVPGDVVRGRILHVSADGQTTLQIGPHKVASNRPLGGRAGDILLFEVLPSGSKRVDGATSSEPLVVRFLESARPVPQASGRTIPEKASAGHLASSGRTAARAALAPIPVENQASVPGPVPLVVSALQMVETLRVLGRKWIQRSRHRLAPADRRESDLARREPQLRADSRATVNDRATITNEKTLPRASDCCDEYAAGFKLAADRDQGGKALIKLQAPRTGKSRREGDGTFAAWLGLDLENTGSIEVDVQMSTHCIRVRFRTDNEDTGDAIRSETGRIRTALKHLAPEVYCKVQVDKERRMDDAALECRIVTSRTGIDCKI